MADFISMAQKVVEIAQKVKVMLDNKAAADEEITGLRNAVEAYVLGTLPVPACDFPTPHSRDAGFFRWWNC